jgi:hypothetical protein
MKTTLRKPGNPGKVKCENVRVSTYVTPEIAEMLSTDADALGISLSEYIKRLIFIAIAKE